MGTETLALHSVASNAADVLQKGGYQGVDGDGADSASPASATNGARGEDVDGHSDGSGSGNGGKNEGSNSEAGNSTDSGSQGSDTTTLDEKPTSTMDLASIILKGLGGSGDDSNRESSTTVIDSTTIEGPSIGSVIATGSTSHPSTSLSQGRPLATSTGHVTRSTTIYQGINSGCVLFQHCDMVVILNVQ